MNGENIANLEDLDIKDVKEEIKKFYEKEPTIKGLEIHQLNDPDTHFPVHYLQFPTVSLGIEGEELKKSEPDPDVYLHELY